MKPTKQHRQLAMKIADELFHSGSPHDEFADRLVLWDDQKNRDLGGWCYKAVVNVIAKALLESGTQTEGGRG